MVKSCCIFTNVTIVYFEVHRICQWTNLALWNKEEVKTCSTEGMESLFSDIKKTVWGKDGKELKGNGEDFIWDL